MLGGYYLRSIIPTNQIAKKMGVLKVEDRTHPATRMLGASWTVGEEFYQFGTAVFDPAKPRENISRSAACRSRWPSPATASTCCSASIPSRPTSGPAAAHQRRRLPAGLEPRVRQGPRLLHHARTSRGYLGHRPAVPRTCRRRHPLGARPGKIERRPVGRQPIPKQQGFPGNRQVGFEDLADPSHTRRACVDCPAACRSCPGRDLESGFATADVRRGRHGPFRSPLRKFCRSRAAARSACSPVVRRGAERC